MSGSPYGANAPACRDVTMQREAIKGRLAVAVAIRDRAAVDGDARRCAAWSRIVDELLDRIGEVRGR